MTNEQVARRMSAAFNARDLDAVTDIFADDFYSHPLDGGREDVRRSWSAMLGKHPGIHTRIEDVLVDQDRAAIRSTVHGLPETNEPPQILEIIRIRDGKIVELWGLSTMVR